MPTEGPRPDEGSFWPRAPEEGFEPPTRRLTAACSAPELLRNVNAPLWGERLVRQDLLRRRDEVTGVAHSMGTVVLGPSWTTVCLQASRLPRVAQPAAPTGSHMFFTV